MAADHETRRLTDSDRSEVMNTDPGPSALATGLPIRTERLTIRALGRSDLEAMHAVYSDPEGARFIPGGVRDRDGTGQRIADLIDHHDRHGVGKWAVTLSAVAVEHQLTTTPTVKRRPAADRVRCHDVV
jgi:hypothetical protein